MKIDRIKDKISLDAFNNLKSKFKEIRDNTFRVERVPPYDSENQLKKLVCMVDNIKSYDFRKNHRYREVEPQEIRHKYTRREKMDYNLKKIEHCIPGYLLEKFRNNKK